MKIVFQKKTKMTKPLFQEFPEVSSKQWKQKIQADLKGADYNDTLIWKTIEGIDVKPFYHQDIVEEPLAIDNSLNQWSICQTIYAHSAKASNQKAINALKRGANAIKFIIPSTDISLSELLLDIDLSAVNVYLECLFIDPEYIKKHQELLSNDNIQLELDIIGNLCKTGNWFQDLNTDHDNLYDIVSITNALTINLSLYQNAGANIVQQLAYSLSHVNEYLNHLDAKIKPKDKASFTCLFNVSIGSNYFFEIAKLRALRVLYKSLASEYGFNEACTIFAKPSKRNKTIYDYNTNMLRTTTECMSAILGGSDAICNMPYDAIYHKNNEFGERIARNQLLVLKHESYFDKVNNPADGAYYIEELTNQLATKALILFKEIEAKGGFLSALKEGTIQRKIKESDQKEQDQFENGEITLLGTNKHPNPDDKMEHELELYPFVKTNIRKTLIEPIIEKRLSEKIEQQRLQTE